MVGLCKDKDTTVSRKLTNAYLPIHSCTYSTCQDVFNSAYLLHCADCAEELSWESMIVGSLLRTMLLVLVCHVERVFNVSGAFRASAYLIS